MRDTRRLSRRLGNALYCAAFVNIRIYLCLKNVKGYVDQCIDRILDLGGEVKNGAKKEAPVCKDPVDRLKYDRQVSVDGLAWLKTLVEEVRDDYTTYDILKKYYQDEEEDLYWADAQLELIDCIGKQNWLLQQL